MRNTNRSGPGKNHTATADHAAVEINHHLVARANVAVAVGMRTYVFHCVDTVVTQLPPSIKVSHFNFVVRAANPHHAHDLGYRGSRCDIGLRALAEPAFAIANEKTVGFGKSSVRRKKENDAGKQVGRSNHNAACYTAG